MKKPILASILIIGLFGCKSVQRIVEGRDSHTNTSNIGENGSGTQFRNLAISTNGDYQTHVLFDDLAMADQIFPGHHQITCDVNAPGENGLDHGSPINDRQYAQFIIAGPGGKLATLFSLCETPVLPPLYTKFVLVGFKYRNPDGIFRKELQIDDTIYPSLPILGFSKDSTHTAVWTRFFFPENLLPPNNHCWEVTFYGIYAPTYSSTASGLRGIWMGVQSSLMYGSQLVLINENTPVAPGDNLKIGYVDFILDEGASDIYWSVDSDPHDRTGYQTSLYISKYKIRI